MDKKIRVIGNILFQELKKMLFMIHSMGGRVLPDVTNQKTKVTHLVAKTCTGDKYTYASTFEIPIMQVCPALYYLYKYCIET